MSTNPTEISFDNTSLITVSFGRDSSMVPNDATSLYSDSNSSQQEGRNEERDERRAISEEEKARDLRETVEKWLEGVPPVFDSGEEREQNPLTASTLDMLEETSFQLFDGSIERFLDDSNGPFALVRPASAMTTWLSHYLDEQLEDVSQPK